MGLCSLLPSREYQQYRKQVREASGFVGLTTDKEHIRKQKRWHRLKSRFKDGRLDLEIARTEEKLAMLKEIKNGLL